ncbi:hypothetical protein OC846_006425 [Tilletia horrida]|uniref:Peptidase A1 domain-containing protein n=1 Tax=Tilletia horrida TaxID=155126 RepID=A0AAN6GIQ2_9BASI|nr:hypothetical protein OC846_006425 [Tilletia horrida]KAK0560630.1 hypothetical protein OC861_006197 [Tilletia horrida]
MTSLSLPTVDLSRGNDSLAPSATFIPGKGSEEDKPGPQDLGAAYVANLKAKYEAAAKGSGKRPTAKLPFQGAWKAGELELVDRYNEILWTGTFSVGTPPTKLDLVFDTGSSDTWAMPGTYYAGQSQTANETGSKFTVSYGDGSSASGETYTETISVAGITVHDFVFGSATICDMVDRGHQGIVGLAFQSISKFGAPPFYQAAFDQKAILKNLFGVGLWTKSARLDFGAIAEEYEKKLVYSPVDNKRGWWMTSFGITGLPDSQKGIIDTGTTLIIGPESLVTKVLTAAGCKVVFKDGQVWGKYPTDKPPKITMTFEGVNYTISDEGLSFAADPDEPGTMWAGVIGDDMGAGLDWVIGGCFLQDVYAVFDASVPRVGFAPK